MSGNVMNLFREETSESVDATAVLNSQPPAMLVDPTDAAHTGFGLSAWCIIPAIGGVALLAAFPSKLLAHNPNDDALFIIFNAAILLAVGFIGSLILFFVFGRSRPVASIAFTLVVGLMSGARFTDFGLAGAQAAMVQAGLQPVPAAPEKKPDLPAAPRANLAQIASSADTSILTSGPPKGSPPPSLSKSGKRWVRTATQLATTYRTAREAFDNGGGLDISNLSSVRACNDRLSLLRRLHLANESFAGYVNSAPDTIRKLLREDNTLPENIESEAQALVGGFDYDLQVSLRKARADYITHAEAMLQLLRDKQGQWTMNAATQAVTFKNEKDTRSYAEHAQRASAAAAKDLEVQNHLASADNQP